MTTRDESRTSPAVVSFDGRLNAVAAVGDVADGNTWSGIPNFFWRAARRRWPEVEPLDPRLHELRWARRRWNFYRLLRGLGSGGYQYSPAFLKRAEAMACSGWGGRTILSFHHQFPRAASVRSVGGRIYYYLDAVLAAMVEGRALEVRLPAAAQREALAIERDNLRQAEHVFVMAHWLRDFLLERRLVEPARLSVCVPGANLELPVDWRPEENSARASPQTLTLGLIGNDWKRKGLPVLIEVARQLRTRGIRSRIIVIGRCPANVAPDCVEVVGPIDKAFELERFVATVQRCDLGCLFSSREALGISILEFLRLGVPVTGFAHEGPADTLPPVAGIRFASGTGVAAIADRLAEFACDPNQRAVARRAAQVLSPQLTWDRCVGEIGEVLSGGRVANPFQLWPRSAHGPVNPLL